MSAALSASFPIREADAPRIVANADPSEVRAMHRFPANKLLPPDDRSRSGSVPVEYGLLAAGIAVAIVGVLGSVGTNLSAIFPPLIAAFSP